MTTDELNTLWMNKVRGFYYNPDKGYWEKRMGISHYTISHLFPATKEERISQLREIGEDVPDELAG